MNMEIFVLMLAIVSITSVESASKTSGKTAAKVGIAGMAAVSKTLLKLDFGF